MPERAPIKALLSLPSLAGFELLRSAEPATAPEWVLEATCAGDAEEAMPGDIIVAGRLDELDAVRLLVSAGASRGASALALPVGATDAADDSEALGSLAIVTYPAWMPRHRAAELLALTLARDTASERRLGARGFGSEADRPDARSVSVPSRRVLAVSPSLAVAVARLNDHLPARAEIATLHTTLHPTRHTGTEDEGVALLRVGPGVASADIRRSLRAAAAELSLSIGTSNVFGPDEPIDQYVAQAREALTLGAALFGGGHVSFYENLYLYKAFIDDGRPELLLSFSRDTLARLREWDERHGSELLRTVEAFFEQDRSVRRTAERLGIHRHTLRSRLERIEEVTACPVRGEGGMSFELLLAYKHLSKVKL